MNIKMNTRWIALLASLAISGLSQAAQDSDHDGVVDEFDVCPNTAQLKKVSPDFKYAIAVNPERRVPGPQAYPVDAKGCEFDSDSDGVLDSKDYCPEDTPVMLSKGVAANGCPRHSDFDGTPDYRDQCPDTPRGIKTDNKGCPVTTSMS